MKGAKGEISTNKDGGKLENGAIGRNLRRKELVLICFICFLARGTEPKPWIGRH